MFFEYQGDIVEAVDTGAKLNLGDALGILYKLGWDLPQDHGVDPHDARWLSADYDHWDHQGLDPQHPWYGLGWEY